jgi:hypothetical protein
VFFINVPIGVVTAALALRLVPRTQRDRGSLRRLDLPGALTVVAGLVLAVYAIEGTATYGWGSARTLVLLGLSAALLTAFARIERRARWALVPPSTWRLRSLVSSGTVMFGATGILVGAFFINSLLLQNVLGASALETGFAFLPLVVVIGIAAHAGPHLLTRFGARTVVVGALMLIVAANLYLAAAPDDAGYLADLLPGFLLLGFGVGLTLVAVSVTAMSEIDGERAGLASGLMTTAHEVGAAFGVSIFSAVALGAGAANGAGFADGYGDGALAGAAIAATLAVIAVAAVPAFRPASAEQVALH